jgi:hypothetical protein
MLENSHSVKGVVLIDSHSPMDHVPISDSQFQMNSSLLDRYELPVSSGPFPRLAMLRSRDPVNIKGSQTVPLWLQDRADPRKAVIGWESLVGTNVKLWDIPGDHFQPFIPSNVSARFKCRPWRQLLTFDL